MVRSVLLVGRGLRRTGRQKVGSWRSRFRFIEPQFFGALDLHDPPVVHHHLHNAITQRRDLRGDKFQPLRGRLVG